MVDCDLRMSRDLKDLLEDLKRKVDEVSNLKSLVELAVVTLENEKKDHEKIVEMMRSFSTNDSEIVLFNVGGQTFSTYVSTVTKRIRRMNAVSVNPGEEFYEPNLLQGKICLYR